MSESDPPPAPACPHCGQAAPSAGLFCTACGRSLADPSQRAERGASMASVARPVAPSDSARSARGMDAAWCAGLVAAVLLQVAVLYGLGDDNALFTSYDIREIFTYHKAFYRDALLDGRVPLWNPHTFSGWPFAANALTQVFYPPALLALVLPQPQALILDLLLHLIAAALGTYWLLRVTFGVAPGPAAVGAVAFAGCGALVGHAYVGHIQFYDACAYLPFIMLALDRTARNFRALPRPVASAPGSDARGRAAPGSDGATDTDVAPRHESHGRSVGLWNWLVRAGAWPWIGGVLLGLQLLTGGIQFAWYTLLLAFLFRAGCVLTSTPLRLAAWRDEAVVFGIVCGVGLGVAAVQLAPGYELAGLSNRGAAGFGYVATGSFPVSLLWSAVDPDVQKPAGVDGIWEFYGYMGYLPLVLALLALVFVRHDVRIAVLVVCGVPAIVYMLGENTPLLRFLWSYVPGFSLFRNPNRALVVVQFIVAVLAAIGSHRILALPTVCRSGAPLPLIAALAALLVVGDTTFAALRNRTDPPKQPGGPRQPRLLLPDWRPIDDPQNRTVIDWLKREMGSEWNRLWIERRILRQNHVFALKARSIGGYDNLYLMRYSRFVHAMTDTAIKPELITMLTQEMFTKAPSPAPFKILGERVTTYRGRPYTRPDGDPVRRAWFTTCWRTVADEAAVLARMRSDQFVPFGEVIFESPEAARLGLARSGTGGGAPASQPTVEVRVTELTPEHLRIDVGPHPAGYLVLSEIDYPGWRARVAKREIPVVRADSILRCLPLEGADSRTTIDMTFEPASVYRGAAVSGVTLVAAAVVAVGVAVGRRNIAARS